MIGIFFYGPAGHRCQTEDQNFCCLQDVTQKQLSLVQVCFSSWACHWCFLSVAGNTPPAVMQAGLAASGLKIEFSHGKLNRSSFPIKIRDGMGNIIRILEQGVRGNKERQCVESWRCLCWLKSRSCDQICSGLKLYSWREQQRLMVVWVNTSGDAQPEMQSVLWSVHTCMFPSYALNFPKPWHKCFSKHSNSESLIPTC